MICPHDDDPQTCPPCVNARNPGLRDISRRANYTDGSFIAQYDSLCPECDGHIYAGDRIIMGEDGAIHAEHLDAWGSRV